MSDDMEEFEKSALAADAAMADGWSPPFCAHDTELTCPACGAENAVCVREHETYWESNSYEAYCCDCHAALEVQASITVEFSDPGVVDL